MLDIREFLDIHVNVKYDKRFCKDIQNFKMRWMQKSSEYIEFMGSNLTGYHKVRFSTLDEDILTHDIFNVDANNLQKMIYGINGINKDFKVTSNVIYIILVYSIHKITVSSLSDKEKVSCCIDLYMIIAFKMLSSLFSHYFSTYSVDESTAKLVYEKMSNRFLLKKLNSWYSVLEYRANDILKGGLHYDRVLNLNTENIVRIISDLQSRLRDIIKNVYVVLMEVKSSKEKIISSSSLEDIGDGNIVNKSVVNDRSRYLTYLRNAQLNSNDFLRTDLVNLIHTFNTYSPKEKMIEVIKSIPTDIKVEHNSLDDFNYYTLELTFTYLNRKGINANYNKHIVSIIKHMKNFWGSYNIKDPNAKRIKKIVYDIIENITGIRTQNTLSSLTVSILIYLFLRSILLDVSN